MNKLLAVALLASVAIFVMCAFASNTAPGAPQPPATETPLCILDSKIAELRLDPMPLGDAIDKLRDLTHANIVVEWPQLKQIGVERSTPVRVRLWDITLGKALAIVLDDVDERLGFQDQDRVVIVSTRERLATKTVVRIYDVRPLLESLAARVAPGQPVSRQEIIDAVTKLIEDTIETDSWKDNGGSCGSLREILGLLVVEQVPSSQRRVQELLEELQSGQGPHVVRLGRPAVPQTR